MTAKTNARTKTRSKTKGTSGSKPRSKQARKPRSLVTGACGFMGTHMLEVLHEAGHEVVATDLEAAIREDDRARGRFPSVARKLGIELHASDMRVPESLKPLTKDVDHVFHIASVFSYSVPWVDLEAVNVQGTRNLVELLFEHSPKLKRLVLWGAGGVYGLPGWHHGPYTEDMPVAPANDYLRSKWFQEHFVMKMGRTRNLPYSIMRPTTVYGPRAVYGSGPLLMGPAEMKVVAVPRNFTARIPFVHVRDVCQTALHLATTPATNGEVYNLNDDSRMTNVEFMQYVTEITGHRFIQLPAIPIEAIKALLHVVTSSADFAARHGLPLNLPLEADTIDYIGEDYLYSNDKLKATGYKFSYPDPRPGIRETLEWYRDQGWISY